MSAPLQKAIRKRQKSETLSKQEALDFAQLILDIYKDKKEL